MQAGSGSENFKKNNNAHTQKPIHARAARSHPSLLFLLFFLHQPPYWMSKLSVTVLFRRQIRHRFLLQVAFEAHNYTAWHLTTVSPWLKPWKQRRTNMKAGENSNTLRIFLGTRKPFGWTACLPDFAWWHRMALNWWCKTDTRRWGVLLFKHQNILSFCSSDRVFPAEYNMAESIISSPCIHMRDVWKTVYTSDCTNFPWLDDCFNKKKSESVKLCPL